MPSHLTGMKESINSPCEHMFLSFKITDCSVTGSLIDIHAFSRLSISAVSAVQQKTDHANDVIKIEPVLMLCDAADPTLTLIQFILNCFLVQDIKENKPKKE